MTSNELTTAEKMADLGADQGTRDGSWAVDGNTSDATLRMIWQGYNDGDPEIMDMQPSPLSGEWADGPFIPDVLEEVGLPRDYDGDDLSDLLDAYEMAYSEAYWTTVLRSVSYLLG